VLRTPGQLGGEEFEGDKAAQTGVLGLVDDSHPAPAKLFDHSVVRDGLTNHGRQSICYG
jgi:hypothetical protein